MPRRLRSKLGYAHVTATLALFVALGGSSYAAVKLTGKDIADGTLTTKDVKNKSLTRKDFKGSVKGRRGATGAQRAAGPQGATGPAGPVALGHLDHEAGDGEPGARADRRARRLVLHDG